MKDLYKFLVTAMAVQFFGFSIMLQFVDHGENWTLWGHLIATSVMLSLSVTLFFIRIKWMN